MNPLYVQPFWGSRLQQHAMLVVCLLVPEAYQTLSAAAWEGRAAEHLLQVATEP